MSYWRGAHQSKELLLFYAILQGLFLFPFLIYCMSIFSPACVMHSVWLLPVGWAISESGSASSRRWCWQSPRACSKPAQKDRWHVDLWWSRAISLETLAAWLDWPISIGSPTSCCDSCTLLKLPNPPGVSHLSSHPSCASCIFPAFRVIWVIRVAHFAFFAWVHYLTAKEEREYTRLFSAYAEKRVCCSYALFFRQNGMNQPVQRQPFSTVPVEK